MDAYEAILGRRSVRRFKPTEVPRDLMLKVLDAGRHAPTAMNEQPWHFVVIADRDRLRELADLTDYGKFIASAGACIVVLSKPWKYYLEDGCAATVQMLVAAHALGLGTCWVAGDKKAYAGRIVALCGAPREFQLVSLIAIGYPAEQTHARKLPLDELVHWETFE